MPYVTIAIHVITIRPKRTAKRFLRVLAILKILKGIYINFEYPWIKTRQAVLVSVLILQSRARNFHAHNFP